MRAQGNGRRKEDRWAVWDRHVRDLILFGAGIFFAVNELIIETNPRYEALIFIAGILGVPFVLRSDEKHREGK